MAADLTFQSGFGGNATINAKLFPVISWSLNLPADILVYKNSKSGNHPVRAATYTDVTGTIVIDYNQTDEPFLASQGTILPGTMVTNCVFLLSQTAYDCWTIPQMIVTNTPQSLEVAGKISTSIAVAISGSYISIPGNSGSVSF